MKKVLLAVFIGVFALPIATFASNNAMFGGPTPVQSFHEAGVSNSKASEAAAMAKVRAIMQQAKQDQAKKAAQQGSHTSQATAPSSPVKHVSTPPPSSVAVNTKSYYSNQAKNTGNGNSLQAQISTLNQTNLMFEQRANQKIETLNLQNNQLQSNLGKLKEALILLNQEVTQMNGQLQSLRSQLPNQSAHANQSASSSASNSSKPDWLQPIKNELGSYFNYLIYGVLAILLVIIGYFLPHRKKSADQQRPDSKVGQHDDEASDIEGDYDYMQSREAIPSKLDLARSYFAMEDYPAAKEVLLDILKVGNEEQCGSAQKILDEIALKS